ncbi:hypothetical protein EEB18_014555 [Sphingopyxis sp. OPL5]|uniref:hypothetical protein n=1 Tax=Sphingopyxis sp. OPL5 TaxID=2486273 RepID=UPI00164D29DD|nr:hypothetical protein [Sphingopyxis sp. OPL5]QNO26001.1 hypothetical protein EEB18_014555 [Sphingopyxis sp. OPL5]
MSWELGIRGGAILLVAAFTALLAACGKPKLEPPKIVDRHAHCDLATEKPEAITDAVAAEPVARALRAMAERSMPNLPRDQTARFWAVKLPCNEMIVAWLFGRHFCGTGGCNLLVWDASGGRLREIGDVSISWGPVRLLGERHNGRPVFGSWTQGGGIQPGYERAMRFDGNAYPKSMGKEADVRMAVDVPSILLIGEFRKLDEGLPLYSEQGNPG